MESLCEVDLRGHCAFCLRRLISSGGGHDDGVGGEGEGQRNSKTGSRGSPRIIEAEGEADEDELRLVPKAVFQVPPRRYRPFVDIVWGYLLKQGGGGGGGERGDGEVNDNYKFVGEGEPETWFGTGDEGVGEIPPMCQFCGDKIQELARLHEELLNKVEVIQRIVVESSQGGKYSWRGEELLKRIMFENTEVWTGVKESTLQFLDKLLESSRQSLAGRHRQCQESRGHGMDDEDSEHIKEEVESPVSSDADEARISGMEFLGEDEEIPEPGESRAIPDGEANNSSSLSAITPTPSYSSNEESSRSSKRKRHCRSYRTSSQRKCKRSPILDEKGDIDHPIKEEADSPSLINEDEDNISIISHLDLEYDQNNQSEEEEEKVVKVRRRVNRRKKGSSISTSKRAKKSQEKLRAPKSNTVVVLKCDADDACTENFKSEMKLQAHKIKSHGMEPFRCQYCDKAFSLQPYLEKHEAEHGGSKEFKCDFENCGKIFQEIGRLKKHKKYHEMERTPCDTCGKAFLGKPALQQHIDSVHLGLKKFVCEVCGIHLATLYSLINHRRNHTGERPHKCSEPYCDKGFKQRAELVQHLERHHRAPVHNQTRQSCRRGRHRNHGPVDPSRKTFICDSCGKGFVSDHNRRLHKRQVHADTPPCICETCGDQFRSEDNLKMHVRIHTMERPYSCHICNQPFRTGSALCAHVKRHKAKGAQFRPKGPMKTFKGRAC